MVIRAQYYNGDHDDGTTRVESNLYMIKIRNCAVRGERGQKHGWYGVVIAI